MQWNAPGGVGSEIIVINPQQALLEEYNKIIQSGKPALVLIHNKHKETFNRIRDESLKMQLKETKKKSGTVAFILTQQDSALWYSINININ